MYFICSENGDVANMVAEFLINFSRLRNGILLYILGVLCMFIIDISGHATNHSSRVEYIFNFSYNEANRSFDIPYYIGMHWEVCIPTNFLFGIGSTLVTATIFEFVSAQSPQSIKSLLLGMYYALAGVLYKFVCFQLLISCTIL